MTIPIRVGLAGAEQEFRRALELNPNQAAAHRWYSLFLSQIGRNEALEQNALALKLDPLSLIINTNTGHFLCFARRYDEAIERLQKVIERGPNFPLSHFALAWVYEAKGMLRDSRSATQKCCT